MQYKKNMRIGIVILFLFIYALLYPAETMTFTIEYLGITAANVSFHHDNERITINTSSTKFAGLFASSFDNTYTTTIDSLFLPKVYQKNIQQSNFIERSVTVYDFEKLQAIFVDTHNDNKTIYDINNDTRDFFATLYYLRTLDLKQDHSLTVDAAGKIWIINIKYIKNEQIKSAIGNHQTKKVMATFTPYNNKEKMRSDIFTNNLVSPDNTLYIWFTDDETQIPVRTQYNMKPFNINWVIQNREIKDR